MRSSSGVRGPNTFTLFSINSLDYASVQSVSAPPAATEALMPKRKAKSDSRYAEQPAVSAILKLLRRPRGATEGGARTHADEGRGDLVYRCRTKVSTA